MNHWLRTTCKSFESKCFAKIKNKQTLVAQKSKHLQIEKVFQSFTKNMAKINLSIMKSLLIYFIYLLSLRRKTFFFLVPFVLKLLIFLFSHKDFYLFIKYCKKDILKIKEKRIIKRWHFQKSSADAFSS